MADNNSNFAASPYPVYNLGGGDDDSVQHAILTSHAGASVERNQDAGFASVRSRDLTSDVLRSSKDNAIVSLENRVELEKRAAVSDRHRDRQFAELKAELAAMRAEAAQREITALRQEKTDGILVRIAAKLGA